MVVLLCAGIVLLGATTLHHPADTHNPAIRPSAAASLPTGYVSNEKGDGRFTLAAAGQATPLYVDAGDYPGVVRAAKDLQVDVERVTGVAPALSTGDLPASKSIVLVGTLGKSPVIDRLAQEGKIDVADVTGCWETFALQVVDQPMAGVDQALVIFGSDKRGTIYGLYDLSGEIGVSPWYWWADVPVPHQSDLYVLPGLHTRGEPAVKYRGFFINDENPALYGWVNETFGGFNHQFYEKVFELLLRMKANYLWPAMWGKAFSDDDPLSPKLADEYGIVMGTSHHEPLARAHVEWERYGHGPWNYDTNPDTLRDFWTEGIRRMGDYENIVTVGMRGDGDAPMTQGTAIALLERIVADQRQILADVTGKDPATIPQLWALYKEVQDYYDQGMRVPNDITLLFSDDNWGNIRRLPELGDSLRPGGYGIYYHFDYVGGPRNYKWINTNPIPRVWEQMHLAHAYGADQIWIVNVGDIKPMEFPTQFFLDYAWNPDAWPLERLPEYTQQWAEQQFGGEHAAAIADIIAKYGKYNGRRKPELLSPDTYSLFHDREAERVVADYNKLADEAERIYDTLPDAYKAAYYQLVLFPVKASANLNELYVTAAKNHLYAAQGRAATNDMAQRVRDLFANDAALTRYFHEEMADGKWNHMMSQTHIGYRYWQEPRQNNMPEVEEIELADNAEMGVAIEGSAQWWPMETGDAVLPTFDPYRQQSYYIEVFNRGQKPFDYTVQAGAPWLKVSPDHGNVEKEQRLWVSVDWRQAPNGEQRVPITISGPGGSSVVVQAAVFNPASPKRDEVKGFVESNGYVSIEAEDYTRAVDAGPIQWKCIPDLGRTASAMAAFPVTAPSQTPGGDSPHLEYRMHLFNTGRPELRVNIDRERAARFGLNTTEVANTIRSAINGFEASKYRTGEDEYDITVRLDENQHQSLERIEKLTIEHEGAQIPITAVADFEIGSSPDSVTVRAYLSPTLNFHATEGLRFAVSIDDQPPQIVNMHAGENNRTWEQWVANNINIASSTLHVDSPGDHVLKFWMVDPGVVLQKLVVETRELDSRYLGPPESFHQ